LATCPQKLRRRSTDTSRHSLEGSQRLAAQPAQQQPVAATVSRELLVAQQPSPLIDDGGVVVRPWVSTPPMITLVRCARATSQASQAPAGRADTP
jgi:hypothetical protein